MKPLYSRINQSKFHCDDFGRGKSRTPKARHGRFLKRRTRRILNDIFEGKAATL